MVINDGDRFETIGGKRLRIMVFICCYLGHTGGQTMYEIILLTRYNVKAGRKRGAAAPKQSSNCFGDGPNQ